MEKIVKIGKTEVRLNNNAAWTMEYRDQFNKDIIPALMPIVISMFEGISSIVAEAGTDNIEIESLAAAVEGRSMDILLPLFQVEFVDTIINVTWALAKAADENIEPPKKWIRQFDEFPLDVVVPAVYELVISGFVSSKNLKRLKKAGKGVKDAVKKQKLLQPSLSTTSSSQDSSEA